jgi:hypothetical protein
METHHPLMEIYYYLWKPLSKTKELSFAETIFEKHGMYEKKTMFVMLNLLKQNLEKNVGFYCIS